MTPDERKEYRDYAWSYFSLHADHRLKVFSFFIVFASLTIGGFSTLVGKNGFQSVYGLLLLLLSVLSFLFWKFEERTRMLVKNGENALKHLDQTLEPEDKVLALFERDDETTSAMEKWPIHTGHFSYSRVFRWVYAIFGIGSFIGWLYALACA